MTADNVDSFFFGVHYMIDGYNSPKERLSNRVALEALLIDIPTLMGMHTITEPIVVEVGPNNKKDPGGLSGVVLIAESHLTFHTFPDRGFVTLDVYTCKDSLDTETLTKALQNAFGFTEFETHYIERGRNYPLHDTV